MANKPKVASLFMGIGAGDIAMHQIGFETVFGVEINKKLHKGLKTRFPQVALYEDVKKIDGKQWKGKIDILVGGFPCQAVSIVGSKKGFKKDSGTSTSLAWDVVRILEESQAPYAFLENVEGFMSPSFSGERTELFSEFARLGYGGLFIILGGQHVGAPQKRNRFWLLLEKQENPTIKESKFTPKKVDRKNFWPTPTSSGVTRFTFKRKDGIIRDHVCDVLVMDYLRDAGWTDEDIYNVEKVKAYLTEHNIYPNIRWLECLQGLPENWLDHSKKPVFHVGSSGEILFPAKRGEPQKPWEPSRICNVKPACQDIRGLGNLQMPAVAKLAFETLAAEMGISLDKISQQERVTKLNENQ